jgi:cysteine desulfurase/selenocysteine lyase
MPTDPPVPDPVPHLDRLVKDSFIDALGRGFARRNPIEGLDPLPMGRDAVTYSIGGIAAGREPGQHWPELNAFRLSEDFPAGPVDPVRVAERGAQNLLPALMFPSASPVRMPGLPREGAGAIAGAPSWLMSAPSPAGVTNELPSWLPPPPSAPSSPARTDDLPVWLRTGPAPGAAMSRPADPRDSTAAAVAPSEAIPGIRADFPALQQEVHGHRLVWLDNAATTQKPQAVIDAISRFYATDNSNVHRAAHELAARATEAYESARLTVQRFLGARSKNEIVFVRGTTEAINLVAQSWGRAHVRAGDVILVTHLEHHSNIVPWQLLCEATGAALRVVPVDDAGNVRLDAYEAMLGPHVKLVALPHVSNAIGTVVPVVPMVQMAQFHGARVLVDGAQSVAHLPVDVASLGPDFFVFSGHKIYGPTGIGVLYGKEDLLGDMPPWQGGGSMIEDVTFERSTYARPPARFEAGTPSLGDAVGLKAALEYVERVGRPAIAAREHALMNRLVAGLSSVPGLSIVGAPAMRVGAVSFVLADHEPRAVAQHLNRRGIAVRAGHHCAQPILRRFGHEATVRPSLGIYNDETDVAHLIQALRDLTGRTRR